VIHVNAADALAAGTETSKDPLAQEGPDRGSQAASPGAASRLQTLHLRGQGQ